MSKTIYGDYTIDIENIINFNYAALRMPAIMTYTAIFSAEYSDLIHDKLNSVILLPYDNVENADFYIEYLRKCKRRECAIEFLEELGYATNIRNYANPLPAEIEQLLNPYIGSSYEGFGECKESLAPVLSFKKETELSERLKTENQLKLINYLLDTKTNQITNENLNSFLATKKGKRIIKRVEAINSIYQEILEEYKTWEESMKPTVEKIIEEKGRNSRIKNQKSQELYNEVFYKLSPETINKIKNKNLISRLRIALGASTLETLFAFSTLPYFMPENIEALLDKKTPIDRRKQIFSNQLKYLKELELEELDFPEYKVWDEQDVEKYCKILRSGKLDKYIPSETYIKEVFTLGQQKYEEAQKETITTSENFKELLQLLGNNENSAEFLYENIINQKILTYAANADNNPISLILCTVRNDEVGQQLYLLLHELQHAIERNPNGFGLDISSAPPNQYESQYRRYEKINEALTDIFAIEATKLLTKNSLFLLEPKEFVQEDYSNNNTLKETKDLLMPLVERYREQVINAKISSNHESLTEYIGKENFEQLVDVVNKVEYLKTQDLRKKLDDNIEDTTVAEYKEATKQAQLIYSSIENYHKNRSSKEKLKTNKKES